MVQETNLLIVMVGIVAIVGLLGMMTYNATLANLAAAGGVSDTAKGTCVILPNTNAPDTVTLGDGLVNANGVCDVTQHENGCAYCLGYCTVFGKINDKYGCSAAQNCDDSDDIAMPCSAPLGTLACVQAADYSSGDKWQCVCDAGYSYCNYNEACIPDGQVCSGIPCPAGKIQCGSNCIPSDVTCLPWTCYGDPDIGIITCCAYGMHPNEFNTCVVD